MIICLCNNVNTATITHAIEEGAYTVKAVEEKTCAGSSCGKCQFKVNALIQDTLPSLHDTQQAMKS